MFSKIPIMEIPVPTVILRFHCTHRYYAMMYCFLFPYIVLSDYVEILNLTISPESKRDCRNISVVADSLLENDEFFTLSLWSMGRGVIIGSNSSTTINIIDSDSMSIACVYPIAQVIH